MAISCQKIAISWKPIFKNWKCSVINDTLCLRLFGGGNLALPWGNLELPRGRFATKSSLCHHFAHVIYNRTLPIIEDWFPRNGNFLARNHQFLLRELYVLNLYFIFKIFKSEQKIVNIKMSNHHGAVGSKKTKNYEIIRSHQAFTFGTVPLDHTVVA